VKYSIFLMFDYNIKCFTQLMEIRVRQMANNSMFVKGKLYLFQ